MSDGDDTAPRLPPHLEPVSASGMHRWVIWPPMVVHSGSGGRPLPEQVQKMFSAGSGPQGAPNVSENALAKHSVIFAPFICTRVRFVCSSSCLTSLTKGFITFLSQTKPKWKNLFIIQIMTFCVILQRGIIFTKKTKSHFTIISLTFTRKYLTIRHSCYCYCVIISNVILTHLEDTR